MQTLLLACYICLQLTSLPKNSTFGDLLKRDTACDQCLTGLFDNSELALDRRVQTTGELLISDKGLQEILEKRLIDELHTRSMLWPRKQPQETAKDVDNAKMMVEDMLQTTEIAMKDMQEKAVEKMKTNLQEMFMQLETQQEQLRNELKLVANRQPEMGNQNKKQVIYDIDLLEVMMPKKNILTNEEKLAVGESLMSENGRFRATMENSGLVVITDQTKGGRIVKTFGEPRSDNPESELYLTVQSNGNLVIKDEEMSIWHSGRLSPKAGRSHFLKLENDGQMVMYNGWNYRVWTSGFPE